MAIGDQFSAPSAISTSVAFYEGTVRRSTPDGFLVDLDGGGSAGPAPTSLTVAEGDWVLVAVGRRRTWIVEVQPA